jgi:hypothetical protein
MQYTTSEEKIENLRGYAEVQLEILKLRAAEKGAEAVSAIATSIIIAVLAASALFFLNIAGAFYLSNLFKSHAIGFLLAGGIYLLLTVIFMLFRKQLLTGPVRDRVINTFLS